MLSLESGGRKKGCAPFKPLASHTWIVISAENLPNPHGIIKKGEIEDDFASIQRWISNRAPNLWKRKLKQCMNELKKGMNVRVQCAGGQHRSYSIVEAVASAYEGALDVAHRDRKKPLIFMS